MPFQPTRFCSCRPNCPNRITRDQRYCSEGLALRDSARFNAELRRLYHTVRWRRRRREQLDREPACADCLQAGKLEPATDAHHLQRPRSEAEFFSIPLGSLCHSCHTIRTNRGE